MPLRGPKAKGTRAERADKLKVGDVVRMSRYLSGRHEDRWAPVEQVVRRHAMVHLSGSVRVGSSDYRCFRTCRASTIIQVATELKPIEGSN